MTTIYLKIFVAQESRTRKEQYDRKTHPREVLLVCDDCVIVYEER